MYTETCSSPQRLATHSFDWSVDESKEIANLVFKFMPTSLNIVVSGCLFLDINSQGRFETLDVVLKWFKFKNNIYYSYTISVNTCLCLVYVFLGTCIHVHIDKDNNILQYLEKC